MAKGQSARRRERNAKRANEGNLAKAQRGKAPRAMPLPNAPNASDFKERVPRSLRKILALKESLKKQQIIKQQIKTPQQQQQQQDGDAPGGGSHAQQRRQTGQAPSAGKGNPFKAGVDGEDEDQEELIHQQEEAGSPGVPRETKNKKKAAQKQDGPKQEQQQQQQQAGSGDLLAPAFEQPRKLKQRKKDYLNKKKLKKKGRSDLATLALHEKELVRDEVKFGERVDAPLKVQLKRKHWAGKQADDGKGRLTRIFEKQMAVAKSKMQQDGKQGGQQQQQQQRQQQRQQQQGQKQQGHKQQWQQQQQAPMKKRKHAPVDEGLREAVIEAYRARHGTHAREGQADVNTLKQLVKGVAE